MDGSDLETSVLTRLNAVFLPLCAALVIAANYVPFLLLVRVKKVAACTLVITLAIQNAFTIVNAILWPNNNIPEWWSGVGVCDVQVALKIPLSTLLATSSAYLTWDLASALNTDNPRLHETRGSRCRRLGIELIFCFGVPIIQAGLHYVIQAGRFGVITIYGCADIVDDSWLSPVLGSMWPVIFAIINCYFAVLVVLRLRKHRGVLSNTLSSSGSGLSAKRFFRLFFVSGSYILVYPPVTLYIFYLDVDYPFQPYSWSRVHDPTVWNQILYLPTSLSPPGAQYMGWVPVAMAFCLVVVYGFGSEGKEIYKRWLVGCGLDNIFPSLLQSGSLPGHERNGSSISSQASPMDVISRVAHYYDNARKESQAPISDSSASRKGSGTTFEHVNSLSGRTGSTSTTADLGSTSSHPLVPPTRPMTRSRPFIPATLFASPFRTHTNLPCLLFGANDSSTAPSSKNPPSQEHTQKNTTASLAPNSIETSIWSSVDLDDDLDPHAPRMGTRAYRERERRIREEMHIGVIPDTVTVDFSTPRLAQGGVGVEQRLEVFEEQAASLRDS